MEWYQAVRIAQEIQTLCERAAMLSYTQFACLNIAFCHFSVPYSLTIIL